MKKMAVTLLALGLLIATTASALAAGGPPATRGKSGAFTLTGTITAISGTSVTVSVMGGNPVVKEFVGQNVTVQTGTSTRYLLKTDTATTYITFADLQVGQAVSVGGTIAGDVWSATRITVGAKLIHLP